jgi:hypothetical protein
MRAAAGWSGGEWGTSSGSKRTHKNTDVQEKAVCCIETAGHRHYEPLVTPGPRVLSVQKQTTSRKAPQTELYVSFQPFEVPLLRKLCLFFDAVQKMSAGTAAQAA